MKHARETFKLVATRTSGGSVRRSERDFAVLMSHFSKLLRGSISLEYDDLAEVFQDAFDVQSLPTLSVRGVGEGEEALSMAAFPFL